MIIAGTKVELIATVTLNIKTIYPGLKVYPGKPCKGTVISIRTRCHKGKFIKMITFAPIKYPNARFELSSKKFRELQE